MVERICTTVVRTIKEVKGSDLRSHVNMKYLSVIIISLFVLLVTVQSSKKFVLDEVDFPILSKSISDHFAPIYYRGEANSSHLGIYHPTLYANALGLFVKIFGFSEITVRMFGVLCALLVFFFAIKISIKLFPQWDKSTVLAVFGLMFLLNPYTLANVTLPDIDQTVLPIVLIVHMYLCLRKADYDGKRKISVKDILILAMSFAFALWAKMTLPLILPAISLVIFCIFNNGITRSIKIVLLYSLIGTVIFLVTYSIYCFVLNLPLMYTFNFLMFSLSSKSAAGNFSETVQRMMGNFKSIFMFLNWIGIPLIALMSISIVGVVGELKKERAGKVIVIGLFSMFWMIALMYSFITAPFGGFFKYPYPLYVFAFFPIVIVFMSRKNILTNLNVVLVVLLSIMSFLGEYCFLKDKHFLMNSNLNTAVACIAIITLCASIILKLLSEKYYRIVFMCILGVTIGFNMSVSLVQARAVYPTKYEYGKMGLDRTVEYLRSRTEKGEVIWAMKDVGYYVNNRYEENYAYFFDNDLAIKIPNIIESKKIRYFIVTKEIGQDNIDSNVVIKSILEKYCVVEQKFGNFIIYRSKISL